MEKITFKYEDDINESVKMTFDSEGMDVYDFIERVKYFMLAVGYHPDSIKKVIEY